MSNFFRSQSVTDENAHPNQRKIDPNIPSTRDLYFDAPKTPAQSISNSPSRSILSKSPCGSIKSILSCPSTPVIIESITTTTTTTTTTSTSTTTTTIVQDINDSNESEFVTFVNKMDPSDADHTVELVAAIVFQSHNDTLRYVIILI